MSETATINGKPQRKLLADQLDRLDAIIDVLSEGLNGAVADAAREGTRLAIAVQAGNRLKRVARRFGLV